MTQQHRVQLLDVVLRKRDGGVEIEYRIHHLGVTRDLLLVARDKVLPLQSRRPSRSSTSLSASFASSMRVEEPMMRDCSDGINTVSRSGAGVVKVRHVPLNSSISAISRRISGVILSAPVFIGYPFLYPFLSTYIHLYPFSLSSATRQG